jgi:RHS repeat-associated protein
VNEITSISGSTSLIASDRNGNMIKFPKPDNWSTAYDLVYDAWNRLVGVKDSNNSTKIVDYACDGLNRRVVKKTYTNGTLSETRQFYYNKDWQCLEEHVGSTCDVRYFWGLRYVDDLICNSNENGGFYVLQDANWNVVALTNISSAVQERYTYSSFGKLNVFDASFTPKSVSTFSLTCSFTGQIFDNETGVMLYRNRVYHPTLGRFVQRDPIGYKGGDINLVRYVFNSVSAFCDSFGLQKTIVPLIRNPLYREPVTPSFLMDPCCTDEQKGKIKEAMKDAYSSLKNASSMIKNPSEQSKIGDCLLSWYNNKDSKTQKTLQKMIENIINALEDKTTNQDKKFRIKCATDEPQTLASVNVYSNKIIGALGYEFAENAISVYPVLGNISREDAAMTMIHELSHLYGNGYKMPRRKGTDDYGYWNPNDNHYYLPEQPNVDLTLGQLLQNADTFANFVNCISKKR